MVAELSIIRLVPDDSVPLPTLFGASPLSSSAKARSNWIFCRLSPMRGACLLALPFTPLTKGNRLGLHPEVEITLPAADFCTAVGGSREPLSHDFVTPGRSPDISPTAFRTRPPDLPPAPLMDMDFAIICFLVRHGRPQYPVLVHWPMRLLHASFRPHLAVTPLRFANPSPPSGWIGDFHPQAAENVRRTKRSPPLFGGGRESQTVRASWREWRPGRSSP